MRKIRLAETLASPAARKANQERLRELLWETGEFDSLKQVDYFIAEEALKNAPPLNPRSRR